MSKRVNVEQKKQRSEKGMKKKRHLDCIFS